VLAYADEGSGRGVVFAHGIGSDHTRWAPVIELLRGDFRCVAVDLPGFGASPAVGCDAGSAAGAVHAVVEHLGLVDPVVVGHSLGSTVALLYGVLFGAAGVVAVDPAPLHTAHLADLLAPYAGRLQGEDFDAALVEWEVATFDTGPLTHEQIASATIRPRADVVRSYWASLFDREQAQVVTRQWSDALARMVTPSLILLAKSPTPEDRVILDSMPAVIVEVWEGQGHWLHLSDPERFSARVRRWIDAL
jgi:pimeloyl-ACP methyl ester carboxylesterase